MVAGTGISGLKVNVAEIRHMATPLGAIDITDVAPTTRPLLQLTHLDAVAGSLSVTSTAALDVAYVHASAATSVMQLTSTGSDVIIRAASAGGSVATGSRVTLDAAQSTHLGNSLKQSW